MRRRGSSLGLAAVIGCVAACRTGAPDPSTRPVAASAALRAGLLELRWRRQVTDPFAIDFHPRFRGRPAVDPARSVLYVGGVEGAMYALRTGDGAIVWRFETLGRVEGTPVLVGSLLVFGCGDGAVYALDAATGRMRWRTGTPAEVIHPPVAGDGVVFVVNGNDTVLALSTDDGAVRWRYRRSAPGGITLSGHAGLTFANGRIFTGFSDGTVSCLDATDGSVIWEQDTSADIENLEERSEAHEAIDVDTTPVVIGDTVFAASYSAGVYAFDTGGGGRRWRVDSVDSVAVLGTDGEALYAASATAGLVKLDPHDGSILWARDLDSRGIAAIVPVGRGVLAVPTIDRAFWLLRASDGEPIDGFTPGRGVSAEPTVDHGRLYVASNGGFLYAFRLVGF